MSDCVLSKTIMIIFIPQLDMLGRGLIRREGSGERLVVRPHTSIAASLELAYYANAVVAHYAPLAIVGTYSSSSCQPKEVHCWMVL